MENKTAGSVNADSKVTSYTDTSNKGQADNSVSPINPDNKSSGTNGNNEIKANTALPTPVVSSNGIVTAHSTI